MGNNNKMIENY